MLFFIRIFACILWSFFVLKGPLSAALLTVNDCNKCHPAEVRGIFEDGERHRTAVTCLECHVEHPPKGTDAIPSCSKCHKSEKKPHFSLEIPCVSCHKNPHRPMVITFSESTENKPACLSCHPFQGEEMAQFPSAHAERDCSMCHLVHGTFETCNKCHAPHVEGMDYKTCLRCHKPHRPLDILWQNDIPSSYCAGCHSDKVELQKNNKNKHGGFICVFCHRMGHNSDLQPQCISCHGSSHDRSITKALPDCHTCHRDAHNLLI